MKEQSTRTDKPIKPQVIAEAVSEELEDNAIISVDCGTNTSWAGLFIDIRKGMKFSVSGSLSSMANGLPYAIAAQIAFPERQSVAFVGDGGLTMLMGEFATAVQYSLPIKVIVIKNGTLGMIRWEQMGFPGNPEFGVEFSPIDWVKFAESCGGKGYAIREPNEENIKVVISGAGSAGYGIFKILKEAGCKDIVVTDSKGAIYEGRKDFIITNSENSNKREIARDSNPRKIVGNLEEVIRQADVFIGVSGKAGLLTKDMVQSMNHDAIVFGLTNPDPEILPSDALKAGARIVCTGRSDFPNQVNNALVFPSVLRALLDTRARGLDEQMLVTASYAIASLVEKAHLNEVYVIPKVNDPRILPIVTQTLKEAIGKHALMDSTKTKQS
jgi:hypothetical protein